MTAPFAKPPARPYLPFLGYWFVTTFALLALFLVLEYGEAVSAFRQRFDLVFRALQERVDVSEAVIEGYAAALRAMPDGAHEEARGYARAMLARYPFISSIAVHLRVGPDSLADLEREMREAGHRTFSVGAAEDGSGRGWDRPPAKEEYFPVVLLEPPDADVGPVLGLDADSVPHMQAALRASIAANRPAPTSAFDLAPDERGYILFRPVCADYAGPCDGRSPGLSPRLVVSLTLCTRELLPCAEGKESAASCSLYFDETLAPETLLTASGPTWKAHALEQLLFPRLEERRQLEGTTQRFVLVASEQLGVHTLDVMPALALLLISTAGLGYALTAARSRARSEAERAEAYRQLAEERERLDQRVRERTVELSQLNETLQREVDARRFAQQELARTGTETRQLAHRLLAAQEAERRTLAHELHDDIGQLLTAVRTHAYLIGQQAGDADTPLARSARAITALAGEIYDSAYAIMRRLRPRVLDDLGLVPAIEASIAAAGLEALGIVCHLEFEGQLTELDEQVTITLYRVLQEALTNVVRHAEARNVRVRLARGRPEDLPPALQLATDVVQLTVQDDGRGIAPHNGTSNLGLVGLRERVEALGGLFKVESGPGSGVRLSVTIPLG